MVRPDEIHFTHRVGWLRAAVLGPNDGIARETIPWFPTVNHAKCIGCELCFVTCGRGVYDVHDQDITEFLNEVRALIRENQLVLANENRV